MTFRLIIAAGKDFTDYQLFSERLDYYLQSKTDVELCTGFCKSSDQLAELYAGAKGHTVKPFPPGFKGITPMMAYADAAVVFYDGHSSGCGKLIRECTVPVKVVRYRPHIKVGEDVLQLPEPKKKKTPRPPGDNAWKDRYKQIHDAWFATAYPAAFADGHMPDPIYPKVRESNGLQTAVVNLLNWSGHRAKRINNTGRLIGKAEKKWIPSAAGKGQADVSATIWHGRSAQLEVKAGKDKPSVHQLKEQAKERKAGGCYEFIYSIEQYFIWYDRMELSARNNYSQQEIF